MALATFQLRGSCSSFHCVPSARCRGSQLKYLLPSVPRVGRKDSLRSLKCRSCSSRGAFFILGPKSKISKISAFKGGNRHDDLSGRANDSKSLKNPLKVSYLQHESEESFVESSKVHNVVPAPYTAEDERTTRSLAIQNLFKNWLVLLRTPLGTQPVERTLEEPSEGTSEESKVVQNNERHEVFKAAWCYFLCLDPTIKIPLLMFTPLYLAVNLLYGSEVSKELTPLWILGPLVASLYVKMLRGICNLYVFSFMQTVRIVKNLPAYFMEVHEYLFRGKLKEAMHEYVWQLLIDIKNMDYKEVIKRKLKGFQGWLVEKYQDFVESIWPYYCRTIRFLKRANLI
ncbi:hypothetical protein SASPL_148621 [Salvia splendens]|uniref:Embryo defective 2759 n=1 Tax=Salvia splendens TaxID=180675 RepID=A0A8X8WA97_SALSN|nr:uncharacterized protein LOC121780330 [Salvia splendens]XP_042033836.1 uncharacterized protein LOC121780330 [Salvia splendens]KAG6390876.1 hypothetical protein SASPL_148621 [Salvia splendens]